MHLRSIICFNRFFPNRAGPLMGYFKSHGSCGLSSHYFQIHDIYRNITGIPKIINHTDNSCFNIALPSFKPMSQLTLDLQ